MTFNDTPTIIEACLGGMIMLGGWAARTIIASRDRKIEDLATRQRTSETDIVALRVQAASTDESARNTAERLDEVKAELGTMAANMARREDVTKLSDQVAALSRDLARKPRRS
jgi:hypothetical protein